MTAPLITDINDPQYINQYATDVLALQVYIGGALADPDNQLVTVSMTNQATNTVAFSRAATRTGVGSYQTQLSSSDSSQVGNYTVGWTYTIGGSGNVNVYNTYVAIGAFSATYGVLTTDMRAIVEGVWLRLGDLYDSPAGGPNLATYFQTRFNRGRLAELLRVAMGRLNTAAQPYQTYTLDGNGGASFPTQQWGPLLEQALFVETVKHLRRSYLEQPQFTGGEVTRVDRRDYFDRWGSVLQEEQASLKEQLDVFKIRSMTLGQPRVLVSGGVFGRYGPTRYSAGMAAARGFYQWSARY